MAHEQAPFYVGAGGALKLRQRQRPGPAASRWWSLSAPPDHPSGNRAGPTSKGMGISIDWPHGRHNLTEIQGPTGTQEFPIVLTFFY